MSDPVNMETKRKDPDAALPFAVDWSDWLPDGIYIQSSEWEVPDGLTIDDELFDDTSAVVILSGGVEGSEYIIRNTITATDQESDVRSMVVVVEKT